MSIIVGPHTKRRRSADPDKLGQYLADVGARYVAQAPSWTHGIRRPLFSPDGARLGVGLPGRGILLDGSLRPFGITKPIPHVFERPRLERLRDHLLRSVSEERANLLAVGLLAGAAAYGAELPIVGIGALSSLDNYLAAVSAGKKDRARSSKNTITTVAVTWSCLFRAGGLPAAGAFTGALGASAPLRTTTGALNVAWTAPGTDDGYLHEISLSGTAALNALLLIDLLFECGGISATSVATQTLGAAALTRYTGAIDVQMIAVITTALGATASNITITYVNSSGTGGRTTAALAMLQSGIVERLTPVAAAPFIVLQSGDVGVRSITSCILSASMTAGVFALIQFKPLVEVLGIPASALVSFNMLAGSLGGPLLLDKTSGNESGCLTWLLMANGTSTGQLATKLTQSRG